LRPIGGGSPRVREAVARLGVLQFEGRPDSTRDETVIVPPALVALFGGALTAPLA